MADLSGVNLNPDVEESGSGFVLLPEGWQNAVIISDSLEKTKDGNGRMLVFEWQAIDGPHAGTKIKNDRHNIINRSEVAQNIGQGTVKRICNIIGAKYPPADSSTMYGRPCAILIAHEPYKNKDGEERVSMKIKGYAEPIKHEQAPSHPAQTVAKPSAKGW